ncbi:MAG: ferritin-like domain-containing protein [Deltaproteobacteria bacterium]
MADFDIDRFIGLSGAVKLDDLDWDECRRIGITEEEARVLLYMGDTETHTILYMRDLLAGHSAKDPTITSFLSVWVYEELWHGRAISKLLEVCGYSDPDRYKTVTEQTSIWEAIEMVLSQGTVYITPKFIAAHMTWGAINELTAGAAYQSLEERTKNPVLAELLRRIVKQERKHFAFYYSQAKQRLEGDRFAQKLTSFILRNFFHVVGAGVGGQDNLDFIAASMFGTEAERAPLREAEKTIHALPGMDWFTMLTSQVKDMAERYERNNGPAPSWGKTLEGAA